MKTTFFALLVSCSTLLFSCSSGTTNPTTHTSMVNDQSDSELVLLTKTLERLAVAIDNKLNKSAGRLANNVKTSWEEARIEVLRASTRVEQWAAQEMNSTSIEMAIYLKKAIDKISNALETYPTGGGQGQ